MADREYYPSSEDNSDREESSGLLPTASSDNDGDDSSSNNTSDSASSFVSTLTTRQKLKDIWYIWKIPTLCYIFALLVDGGDTLRSTPRTRLLESMICNRYFAEQTLDKGSLSMPLNDHWLPIPEENCKVAPVQAELVSMRAWLSVGESILALIFAIPFASLATKRSRNFVITLGVCGQILSELLIVLVCYFNPALPLNLIYFSIILKSLGGGNMVISAMVYAILSDVISPEKRGRAFFYLGGMSLVVEMIMPVLGSAMMEKWTAFVPVMVAFPFEPCSLIVLAFIPNTTKHPEETPLLDDSVSSEDDTENFSDGGSEVVNTSSSLKMSISSIFAPLIITWTLVCRNRNLLLVNLSFMVTTLGRETQNFLVQYCSKRFGWKLAKANYLISFRAFVSLSLLTIILPTISSFLTKSRGMASVKVDLWIARVSSIFAVVGPIMIGLSQSAELMIVALGLFTLSFGFRAAIQSFATSLVKPEEVALLYSALACMSSAGTLVASPLIAATYRLGLNIGGAGIGLPFFVAGGCYTIAAVGAWGARLDTSTSK